MCCDLTQPKSEARGLGGEGGCFVQRGGQREDATGPLELVSGSQAGREAAVLHGPAFRQEQSRMGRERERAVVFIMLVAFSRHDNMV